MKYSVNIYKVKNILEGYGLRTSLEWVWLRMKTKWFGIVDSQEKFDRIKNVDRFKPYFIEWYWVRTGKVANLKNPKTFNEKVQWLKFYDALPLKTELADKYLLRESIKKILPDTNIKFIPLIGVWKSFDEIDFNKMPEAFVLKTNHASGNNVIVKDKNTFDAQEAKCLFDTWMNTNYAYSHFEFQYRNIPRRIIAEEYHPCQYEYQFWCINGQIAFISAIEEPHGKNEKLSYDIDWNKLDFVTSLPIMKHELEKPTFLNEMIDFALSVAKSFCFVRVDFLYDGNNLYLGELTFTPASGLCGWNKDYINQKLGEQLDLSKQRKITRI